MSVESQGSSRQSLAVEAGQGRVAAGSIYLVLDHTSAAQRALQWAVGESERVGRAVTSFILLRPQWWYGAGTFNLLPVGPVALRETAQNLMLHHGADLVAHGHEPPRVVQSAAAIREALAHGQVVTVVAPHHLARRLLHPAASVDVPVVSVR